jgi:drug/metabolite transporter (DMT)-like permease
VAAFALWNNALRRWPTSQVFLFNNLIPLSTMSWAHWCLGEQVTRTYFMAMGLIISAVVLSRLDLRKLLRPQTGA